ncbi:hypothetical protein [Vibrio sp. D431a]|uniref:hypothetical protein n=1 Tax=Vibrio sp. D431a TaxID=2837388 RepID=UPI002555D777|nr:hypothetical protein [Vibrio sp. D431a]MDK9793354.1 hypothetical protein [Vibrio sp. D431a]
MTVPVFYHFCELAMVRERKKFLLYFKLKASNLTDACCKSLQVQYLLEGLGFNLMEDGCTIKERAFGLSDFAAFFPEVKYNERGISWINGDLIGYTSSHLGLYRSQVCASIYNSSIEFRM